MLKHLYIKNYALIDELNLDLHEGFSVITGETGAGKSILLGAIALLLGQRADSKAIKQGESRCIIEAELDLSGRGLESFFEREDLDFDQGNCIIRREVTAAGKSRAFINDTPASVAQLKELGEHLIDIHSQHKNLFLGKEDYQLNVLDVLAQNREQLAAYKSAYADYKRAKKTYEDLRDAAQKSREDEDYLQFQLNQLEELNLEENEDEELQKEQQLLEHAEDIKSALYKACGLLSQDNGIVDLLRESQRAVGNISDVYAPASDLEERLESCLIELKDIASEVESGAEDVEFDPQRLDYVNERLNAIYNLEQKHHVDSANDLIALREDLSRQLDAITNSDEHIRKAEEAMKKAYALVEKLADELTILRSKSADRLCRDMVEKLRSLGMPNVNFLVNIQKKATPDTSGFDQVDFLFNANKNATPQSIASIASGGEIARVMLSLKALISRATSLPTIIFDEIDTGVSGQIADRMAEIMKEMCSASAGNKSTQVISITHLPQIAASGRTHYKVYKEDNEDSTVSHIIELTPDQRVEELANMLSGSSITQAALDNARSLLAMKEK